MRHVNYNEEYFLKAIKRRQWVSLGATGAVTVLLLVFVGGLLYGVIQLTSFRDSLQEDVRSISENRDALLAEQAQLNSQKDTLEADIKKLGEELAVKARSNAFYRKLAGIRVRYYREPDRARATRVAMKLDLDGAELRQSRLLEIEPNALAYGSDISESYLVEIALAFLMEGFPLRKLTPATTVREAKLIQVIASADAGRSCQLLTESEIRTGVRCGQPRTAP